jgi:hypothetical protein
MFLESVLLDDGFNVGLDVGFGANVGAWIWPDIF